MFANKNTIQINTSYYKFLLRNPKYAHLNYIPQIFVSRKDTNTIEILVKIFETDSTKKTSFVRRTITYDAKVENMDDYFRSVQNSNFNFALPNSLVFLEKMIESIQSLYSTPFLKDVPPPITIVPDVHGTEELYTNIGFKLVSTTSTTATVAAYNDQGLSVPGTYSIMSGSGTITAFNETKGTATFGNGNFYSSFLFLPTTNPPNQLPTKAGNVYLSTSGPTPVYTVYPPSDYFTIPIYSSLSTSTLFFEIAATFDNSGSGGLNTVLLAVTNLTTTPPSNPFVVFDPIPPNMIVGNQTLVSCTLEADYGFISYNQTFNTTIRYKYDQNDSSKYANILYTITIGQPPYIVSVTYNN
jgi:hypothetical protein